MACLRRITGVLPLGLLLLGACDPPGKPKLEPPPSDETLDFKVLYGENCAGCHGDNGKAGPGRPLNNPLYLAVMPKDALIQTVSYGRPGTAMPAWAKSQGGPLTDKQIHALADGIYQNWSKPQQFQHAKLPSYSGQGVTGNANDGKKLFLRDCFMCHGPGAPIGTVSSASYLQLVSDQMIRTSIIVGRQDIPGEMMPSYQILNFGHALSDQNIADLVAYLASLRPAPGPNENMHTAEAATGNAGEVTRGNEGSGTGPGSPHRERGEGNKSTGSNSQGGGVR